MLKFLKGLVLLLVALILLAVLGVICLGVYEHYQEQAGKQALMECALAEQFPKAGYDCKIPGLGKRR